MKPIQLFDTASSTYTYVLFDATSREAIIIDPVDDQVERDLQVLRDFYSTIQPKIPANAGGLKFRKPS